MKVLLTGAAGFLGRHVAASLLEQGVDDLRLHVRQHAPAGLVVTLRARHPHARIEVVAANLLGAAALAPLVEGVDCIVHAAAGMRGAPADMFANTVVGTRNLLDAATRAGVRRIVLVSSFAVYRTFALPRGATIDEATPVETVGIEKGSYGYAKARQEALACELQQRQGFELVRLRPGVIYGPGGNALSPRLGIRVLGWFLALGGRATLPLTYVENCADAIATATLHAPDGRVFNVVDGGLPSCRDYLRAYRTQVERVRVLPVPYWALLLGSRWLVHYHRRSKGQLPAVFTPYIVRSMYRPFRYTNAALVELGWRQRIPTPEAMRRAFAWLREQPR